MVGDYIGILGTRLRMHPRGGDESCRMSQLYGLEARQRRPKE